MSEDHTDIVACCPDCESAGITSRSGEYPTRHYCRDCELEFDDPAERPSHKFGTTQPPSGSVARELWEMDPDAIEVDHA